MLRTNSPPVSPGQPPPRLCSFLEHSAGLAGADSSAEQTKDEGSGEAVAAPAASDSNFSRFLGLEIRRAREERGLTRAELCKRLPSGIGERTLMSYEYGARDIAVLRLVEVAYGLGASPDELLKRAAQKAGNPTGITLRINLVKLTKDENDKYKSVRAWARKRLLVDPRPVVKLSPETVRELAVAFDRTHEALAQYLIGFIPTDRPASS